MKNTERLLQKVMDFQNERTNVLSEYERRMTALESAKGSKFYDDEKEKAINKRDVAMKKLKNDFFTATDSIMNDMLKVNNSRTVEPPSTEEMNLIQALMMREKVSDAEIDQVANTLKTPLALSILQEVAVSNGYIKHINSPIDKELSVEKVNEMMKGLSHGLKDFAEYDTRKAARLAQEHRANLYGLVDADKAPLPKRDKIINIEGFYSQVMPYLQRDQRKAFANAVDGE